MNKGKITAGYKPIQATFPSSFLSNTYNYLLIRNLQLQSIFTMTKTEMKELLRFTATQFLMTLETSSR